MRRHTCIICKSKRYERYMVNVFNQSWACKEDKKYKHITKPCFVHSDIKIILKMIELSKELKIMNTSNIDFSSRDIVRSGVTL